MVKFGLGKGNKGNLLIEIDDDSYKWCALIGFVLSLICMILFVVLADKLPIKKVMILGGILSGVLFMLLIGIIENRDKKVQNGELNENFNKKD